jgi:hypothetical protein
MPTEHKIREKIKTLFHIDFSKVKNAKKEALIYHKKDRKTDILSIILVLKHGVSPQHLYYLIKEATNNLLIAH